MPKSRTVFFLILGLMTILGLVGVFLNRQLPLEKAGKDIVLAVSIGLLGIAVVTGSIALHSTDEAFEDYD